MTSYSYSTNIPNPPNSPSVDVPNMQVNTNSINSIIAVDHIGFNTSNGGYHTIIHDPAQTVGGQSSYNPVLGSGVPAAIQASKISGISQIFAMNYTPNFSGATADTQLFHLSGNGGISLLTGNQAAQEGWCWVGGILVQWGIVSPLSLSTGTVTFNDAVKRPSCIPFPNNCFAVLCSLNSGGITSSGASISSTAVSTTSFNWKLSPPTVTGYTGFYWFAIGN